MRVVVRVEVVEVGAEVPRFKPGDRVGLSIAPEAVRLLPLEDL